MRINLNLLKSLFKHSLKPCYYKPAFITLSIGLGIGFSFVHAKNVSNRFYFREMLRPQQAVLKSFLQCDADWFTVLTQHAEYLPEIKPTPIEGGRGISYIAVPNRYQYDGEGQSRSLKPEFKVDTVAFNEFIDEVTPLPNKDNKPLMVYYWGFNTDTEINHVLPMIQSLLPKNKQLSADGDNWARVDVFDSEQSEWHNVSNLQTLKQTEVKKPERALIVQTHEGGGTRVLCGLQAAPLPDAELKRLRPDLAVR